MTSAVHRQGDGSGNVFILLLIPPCGAFISMLLSHAVCPVSPHAPKIARGARLCVQHAGLSRTDNPMCGLLHCPARMPACLVDCLCVKPSCSLHQKTCNSYKAAGNFGSSHRIYGCTVVENAN